MSDKIHEIVTDRMIAALDAGTVPWRKPWRPKTGGLPLRMSNGKPYRGVNVFLLALTAWEQGYDSPWWGTFDNIAERAGMVKQGKRWVSLDGTPRGVRKGEKSTLVVWWNMLDVDDEDNPGKRKKIPVLRYFRVFNAQQADGLPGKYYPEPAPERPEAETIASAQAILDGYITRGPSLVHGGDRACYNPGTDRITLPERRSFTTAGEYYSTGLHEATHSTGHKDRLNRKGIAEFDHFGSGRYAREELVAEMGAAFLMAIAGIDQPEVFGNSASYIASWLRELRGDKRLVVTAAGAAQRAADLIAGVTYDDGKDHEEG